MERPYASFGTHEQIIASNLIPIYKKYSRYDFPITAIGATLIVTLAGMDPDLNGRGSNLAT